MVLQNLTRRLKENVNWRFGTFFLLVPILLLYVLAITGCISNSAGVPGIFIVTLTGKSQEIRVGYIGMCITLPGKSLSCSSTAGLDASGFISKLSGNGDAQFSSTTEVEQLVSIGLTLQRKIFLFLPAAAGVLQFSGFIIFGLFMRQGKSTGRNPKAPQRQETFKWYSKVLLWAAVAASFASAVGLAQASGCLQFASGIVHDGNIVFKAGVALQTMQFVILSFSFLFSTAVSLMSQTPSTYGGLGTGQPPGHMLPGFLPPPPPPLPV